MTAVQAQAQYTAAMEHTAAKTTSTPVSFIGGFQYVWPLARTDSTG